MSCSLGCSVLVVSNADWSSSLLKPPLVQRAEGSRTVGLEAGCHDEPALPAFGNLSNC
ncbi:unnamed protein product [Protopolystoma xenopodis]|uniref:Uncharacterized protein n=1 Tax=Protopolystoma xenopodis TaxID=117903 RepID=A0A3S5AKF9_9PLAT|nr:unnamed protein product [Protopolystoma xenopodis]